MTQSWWESSPGLFKTSSTTFIPWIRTWSFISKYVNASTRCIQTSAWTHQTVSLEALLCRFRILKSIWTKSKTCWMVRFGLLSASFRPWWGQGALFRHDVCFLSPPQSQRPTCQYTRTKTGCLMSRWDFIFTLTFSRDEFNNHTVTCLWQLVIMH